MSQADNKHDRPNQQNHFRFVESELAPSIDPDITTRNSMTRNRRTRILIDGNPELSARLCSDIEAISQITLISEPREVLVMNKVRETAQNSLFYLGEALLTECKVTLQATNGKGQTVSSSGLGLIMGEKHTQAYQLAVIDAAFSLPEPLADQQRWVELLLSEESSLAKVAYQKRVQLSATRVQFESMLTEEDREAGD